MKREPTSPVASRRLRRWNLPHPVATGVGWAAHTPGCSRLATVALGLLVPLQGLTQPAQVPWPAPPAPVAQVQPATPAPASPAPGVPVTPAAPPTPSALDAQLFYQLLIGEIELRNGQPGVAYEAILDAARRTRDAQLFRRAVDIAVQARALEQALAAIRGWRQALPQSLDPLRLQVQILAAAGRPQDLGEPLRELLRLTPAAELPDLINALPRFLQRSGDAKALASTLSDLLKPYAERPATAVVARVAVARAWLNAEDPDIALALARNAQQRDADSPLPAVLALELMQRRPAAEELIAAFLARPAAAGQPGTPVRLAYSRLLTSAQRYADAARELKLVTQANPEDPGPLLTLGLLQTELRQPQDAEATLQRYIVLAEAEARAAAAASAATPAPGAAAQPATPGVSADADADDEDQAPAGPEDAESASTGADRGLTQAHLALAQLAEQRGDFKTAETWLAKVGDPQRAREVQSRRAHILARQGQLPQALELVRRLPENSPEDLRAKLLAEAGVLREVKRWDEAYAVLGKANARFQDDPDLLYEQAMMAEKTNRLSEMEALLQRVMALRPESAHAYNALGYSLADRGLRLEEARRLILRALELSPGDPFITDSLGWVEYRLGRPQEALRLLRQAWSARPDTEIGAHLGEVLWSLGEKEEARRIWREARQRDSNNEVLRETLSRLQAPL
jgi:tetratricopeptide (TPR) repeat protein